MQRLYVVTHPESTHHVDGLVGGWYDASLTDHGRARAAELAASLRATIPAAARVQVVSSDLQRVAQTAAAIGGALGAEVVLDADLREKSYGVGEGRPQAWLEERFIVPPKTGERMEHDEGINGAETKGHWIRRTYAAVDRLERSPADHRIIVTHGGTGSWVITAWMRIPAAACAYAAFDLPPGTVSVLEEDDRFHNRRLVALGQRAP